LHDDRSREVASGLAEGPAERRNRLSRYRARRSVYIVANLLLISYTGSIYRIRMWYNIRMNMQNAVPQYNVYARSIISSTAKDISTFATYQLYELIKILTLI